MMPMRANSGGPPLFCDQQQRFHRGLPFVGIVFRFRQFGDVLGGIAQRDQRLLSARQCDRIKKLLILGHLGHVLINPKRIRRWG
jgi:hypothetical protein